MSNLQSYLALNRMNQVGPRTVKKLVRRWPDLRVMFSLSQADLVEAGLPAVLATQIKAFDFRSIEADLAWARQANHTLLTWDSPDYPGLLREIADPPVVLYAAGQLSVLEGQAIAMVGSRNPSGAGAENASRFARELSRAGLVIVSGLALGIDASAHRGCLEASGQTIAVMGTGIDTIYPRRHQSLAEEIKKKGLILSEFPLGSPPVAGHFPRRNRIISGLSLATLVVEAAEKSGSLITARLALEQNRDVLAIPGSINNPMARGCHSLLQQGARLVTAVADVLDELGIKEPGMRQEMEKSTPALASSEEKLVKFVDYELTTVDQIVNRTGMPIATIMGELAHLELAGLIRAMPGGYIRC